MEIVDPVRIEKTGPTEGEPPIMGTNEIRIALSGDSNLMLLKFIGVCLHCEHQHDIDIGWIAVPIEMTASIRKAIDECYNRAKQ